MANLEVHSFPLVTPMLHTGTFVQSLHMETCLNMVSYFGLKTSFIMKLFLYIMVSK